MRKENLVQALLCLLVEREDPTSLPAYQLFPGTTMWSMIVDLWTTWLHRSDSTSNESGMCGLTPSHVTRKGDQVNARVSLRRPVEPLVHGKLSF